MNFNSINKLSSSQCIELDEQCCAFGSSLAYSSLGELFSLSLSNDGNVSINITKLTTDQNDDKPQILQLNDTDNYQLDKYRHILCNQIGNLILLWSRTELAIIERKNEERSNIDEYSKLSILLKESRIPIVKICFHPMNEFAVVVLFETESLCIYDLRTLGKQHYSLPTGVSFSSYCFGPDIEWLRFSIFLTSINDGIYEVCPVIPFGTILTKDVVSELSQWVAKQDTVVKADSEMSFDRKKHFRLYLEYTSEFLRKFTPLPNSANQSFVYEEDKRLNAETIDRSGVEIGIIGPIPLLCGDPDYEMEKDFSEHEDEHCPRYYCDIITCSSRQDSLKAHSSPILATVDINGLVSILLLDTTDDNCALSFPIWKSFEKYKLFPPPDLLTAEQVRTEWESFQNQSFILLSDPVFRECIYCVNSSSGKVSFVKSGWLNSISDNIEKRPENGGSNGEEEKKENNPISTKRLPHCSVLNSEENRSVGLNGIVLTLDPLVGNMLLLMYYNGDVNVVNLSVHRRLRDLYNEDAQPYPVGSLSAELIQHNHQAEIPFRNIIKLMNDNSAYFRDKQKQVLLNIANGFTELPLINSKANGSTIADERLLLETSELLEKNIVKPLQYFSELLRFHQDFVHNSYLTQRELIFNTSTSHLQLSSNLTDVVEDLRKKDNVLVERILSIVEKYALMKKKLSGYLNFAANTRQKLSTVEKVYSKKLEHWQLDLENASGDLKSLRATLQHQQNLRQSAVLKPVDVTMVKRDLVDQKSSKSFVSFPVSPITGFSTGIRGRGDLMQRSGGLQLNGTPSTKRPQQHSANENNVQKNLFTPSKSAIESSKMQIANDDTEMLCNAAIKGNEEILQQAKIRLGKLEKRLRSLKLGIIPE